MIVPPRHYCVIEDPVSYDDDDKVLFDEHGQAVLLYGDEEIRLAQKPFPLYPGEKVKQVSANSIVLSLFFFFSFFRSVYMYTISLQPDLNTEILKPAWNFINLNMQHTCQEHKCDMCLQLQSF